MSPFPIFAEMAESERVDRRGHEAPEVSGRWTNVAEDEPVAFDDLASLDGDGRVKPGPVPHERVELAALAARIDSPREAPRADVRPTCDRRSRPVPELGRRR